MWKAAELFESFLFLEVVENLFHRRLFDCLVVMMKAAGLSQHFLKQMFEDVGQTVVGHHLLVALEMVKAGVELVVFVEALVLVLSFGLLVELVFDLLIRPLENVDIFDPLLGAMVGMEMVLKEALVPVAPPKVVTVMVLLCLLPLSLEIVKLVDMIEVFEVVEVLLRL